MCAESNSVRISDANSGGHYVVDHTGKSVDPENGEVFAVGPGPQSSGFQVVEGNGTARRPCVIGQETEEAIQVDTAWQREAMGEQMQPKIGIRRVYWRFLEIGNGGCNGSDVNPANIVTAGGRI
jgi:hypothetical protein